jgi:large subunit ribosomal protein L21
VYAVVRTGGKQYRVEEGRAIKIDRVSGAPGDTIELGEVLLMGNGEDVTVGTPFIEGARVVGTIAEQGRAKKVIVFRYKAKTRQRKKTGHRQQFTRLVISEILAAGEEAKPRGEAAATDSQPVLETPEAVPEAAAPPRPRRPRRKVDAEPSSEPRSAPAEKPKRSRRKVEE